MSTPQESREAVLALLGPALGSLGLDLEDVELGQAGSRRLLKVLVDKDGGVTLDDIADGTREVSRLLDDSEVMGERPYTLEVGSPGVGRPLTLPRHWHRNHDRLVKVSMREGGAFTGRLLASDEDTARFEVNGRERTVRLADVVRAKVQVEFSHRSTPSARQVGQPASSKER